MPGSDPSITTLETERLRLRSWLDSDRDLFREINSDPKVMEFFPFRRTHAEADELMDKLNGLITGTGLGFYALELKETGEPMGFCGLSLANLPDIFPPATVEIGWRLATRFWGNGYVTEAGGALINWGFKKADLSEIVSFAVAGNRRSTAVMERIGLKRDAARDFDHPRVPASHPQLTGHVVYAITREEWKAGRTPG